MGTPQPPTEGKSTTEIRGPRSDNEIVPDILSDLVQLSKATSPKLISCARSSGQSAAMSYPDKLEIDRNPCQEVEGAEEAVYTGPANNSKQDWDPVGKEFHT